MNAIKKLTKQLEEYKNDLALPHSSLSRADKKRIEIEYSYIQKELQDRKAQQKNANKYNNN